MRCDTFLSLCAEIKPVTLSWCYTRGVTGLLKRTALYDRHISSRGKMGEVSGHSMPLYYPVGVRAEHEWVRSCAGLFDISHMMQIMLEGDDVAVFLEYITPSSFTLKKNGRAQYTVLTNEKAGIVGDLIVTRLSENKFYIVLNSEGGTRSIDWIRAHIPNNITLKILDDRALLSLQGPEAAAVLRDVFDFDSVALFYMSMMPDARLNDVNAYVSRLGYTGEDGFEISVSNNVVHKIWDAILAHDSVAAIGMSARDSLRLEMGYCLYGHDIDGTTTPIEAGLRWVMGKKSTGFIGAKHMSSQCGHAHKSRVGVRLSGQGIMRAGAEIHTPDGVAIGVLTSVGFSPMLGQSIGQGYVPCDYAIEGARVQIDVGARYLAAEITQMPFIPIREKSSKTRKLS